MSKLVMLLSGGIDSMTCCHLAMEKYESVSAVFVNYGHPAVNCERQASRKIVERMKIEKFQEIEVKGLHIPMEGFVQGRNLLLASCALTHLGTETAASIGMGIHAGTSYSDCAKDFVEAIQRVLNIYASGSVQLITPFLSWSKSEIVKYAKEKKLPIDITYSCEKGETPPCGNCNSCRDRNAIL